jgi:hypothetical protein
MLLTKTIKTMTTRKRYFKKIDYIDLCILWGFKVPLTPTQWSKQLYLRVKSDGTVHKLHGGSIESELKLNDIVL